MALRDKFSDFGDFFRMKVTLGIIFIGYFLLRWWSVRQDMLLGLEPSSQLIFEASIFSAIVTAPQLIILGTGLMALFVLQFVLKRIKAEIRDHVTKIPEEYGEEISTLESRELPYLDIGGVIAVSVFFAWMLFRDTSTDVVFGLIAGLGLVGIFIVFSAWQEISDLKKAGIPNWVIQKKINRDGAGMFVMLVSLFVVLVVFSWLLDLALGLYYSNIVANSLSVFSERSIEILSAQKYSPASVLEFYSYYTGDAIFNLGKQLLRSIIPLALIVGMLPYALKNLYFREFSRLLKVIATYMAFAGAGVLIELSFGQGSINVDSVGVSSLLPMVASITAEGLTGWFKEQVGYIDCSSCGEQVSSEGEFCEYCGSPKSK